MAFYNRWNDTVATTLEEAPLQSATQLLGDSDWVVGKHAQRQDHARFQCPPSNTASAQTKG